MTNETKYVIRSMSTTDCYPGGPAVTPYHLYLRKPELRRTAYWSTWQSEAMVFDTPQEAEAEIKRSLPNHQESAQVALIDGNMPSLWELRKMEPGVIAANEAREARFAANREVLAAKKKAAEEKAEAERDAYQGETTRAYAERLLIANKANTVEKTKRAAMIGCINASRLFPKSVPSYWADVAIQIEQLIDEETR